MSIYKTTDYEKKQVGNAIKLCDEIFNYQRYGKCYNDRIYEHVLQNSMMNLYKEIRNDVQKYFNNYNIKWKCTKKDKSYKTIWECKSEFCGNLKSSMVSCLNHLFFLRKRSDLATIFLQNIDSDVERAVPIKEKNKYGDDESGFVSFEIIGKDNYLNEIEHTRGKDATSIDAIMVGEKKEGNILVLIEWKYTEFYDPEKLNYPDTRHEIDKNKQSRHKIYNPHLQHKECPVIFDDGFKKLYYEPYFQLMRQTLLGWKMVEAREYNCTDYIHVHVIPTDNNELRSTITSPGMEGKDMADAWKKVLVHPEKYRILSPDELFQPLEHESTIYLLSEYLKKRYWA